MIATMLREFAAQFQLTGPRAPVDRRTLWLLVCIVAAGAVVRFWGLGSVGLHGDEKTMALPVMNLVEHGVPLMPSGFLYPRAIGQLYLMAAAVEAFGQSEWAMRLPSALCGVLLIVLMWTAGRRFLAPAWNLALAAAVAFLPDFIEDAQTARMYVFLVTCVAGFVTLLFEWERTNRAGYLVAAVAVMLVGLQFHTLAIFAAFLVFIPGLLRGEQRRLWAGALAFTVIVVGFVVIDTWIGRQYPQSLDSEGGVVLNGPHAAGVIPHLGRLWLLVVALPALAFAMWVVPRRGVMAVLLLAAALVAGASLSWHLAALLIVAGLVMSRRRGELSPLRLGCFFAAVAVLASAQAVFLFTHAAGSPKQIVGVLLGWPSVWPFISIAGYSALTGLLVVGALAVGLWRLAHRQPVPDHVLLLVLGLWIPLLMIGFMKWNIPPRYAAAQIVPMLLGGFAAAQWATQWWLSGRRQAAASAASHGLAPGGFAVAWIAMLVCILVVNPLRVAKAVDSGYASHPDHKGAAQFVAALHPGPRDIIVAEDVLQQTYYLGHVNYWLVNKQVAAPFMHLVKGQPLDLYTNTRLIGTGAELEQLVEKQDRGAIYVIGSGENQEDGRSSMRSFGIAEALQSPRFEVVYRGRDGLTEVWKVSPPRQAAAMGSH
jgi:4-amino-4-deoxy-L-arabinose transferase-like glycosyltransferase